MRSGISVALRASTWSLVFSGYLALASARHFGSAVLLVPLIFLPLGLLGERLDRRFRVYRWITSSLTFLCLCIVLAFVALLGLRVVHVSLLDAVTGLIVYIQVYLLMHQRRPRYSQYLFLMSLFLLLVSCVVSPDAGIGVAMFLFLVSAACALFTLQMHTELQAVSGQAALAAAAPLDGAAGTGVGVIPETSKGHGIFDFGLVLVTTLMGLGAFALTVLFFMVMPRFEAGLFGRTDPGAFRTGFSETIDITTPGRITVDRTPVMRVEFPEEADGRYDGPLFWRCSTLNYYEKGIWSRMDTTYAARDRTPKLYTTNSADGEASRQNFVFRTKRDNYRSVRQSIYMDDVPNQGIPALPLVQRLECVESPYEVKIKWDTSGDFTVLMARRGARRLQYDAWSEVEDYGADALRNAADDYPNAFPPRDYRLLTHHAMQGPTRDLVQRIVEGKTNVYDKVVALKRWLEEEGGFVYTLNVPRLDAEYPIDDFILNVKRGHCELFASAMALMLRSLGIPTRVVVGYKGGGWNPADQSYIVRAHMAHSWVEVYFIDQGWVSFDPSPFNAELTDVPVSRLANVWSSYVLRAKMWWYRNVIAYNRGFQLGLLRALRDGLGVAGAGFAGKDSPAASSRNLPRVSFGAFLLALVVGGALVAATRIRERSVGRQYVLTADQARAALLFKRLRRNLARLGVDCHGKTAEEICENVTGYPLLDAAAVQVIVKTYNEVRFGRRPFPRREYALSGKSLRTLYKAS